ncbi:long-chain-fatty-acid--CoA ligase [Curvibacter sp. HBC28]|uniref:Long-chain-fatty-acid--CoA ligase n=1 Tax=Curvibacter microcysteis TaxID=3026419 RepID=A0ABT5MBU2_9BURK|nr:long-chain-fatty-acid--CoA ligase [Curvibacter sp. HBC28]MDD0814033.1 long-chain-fatty-acid--CoA ligase [Curvibacter sp. HBC28]
MNTPRACAPHHRFWPPGVPHTVRPSAVGLSHYLAVAAQRYPDKPALHFCGQSLSYAALQQRVEALAAWLQRRLGVRPGDRVLLMSQNCPQYVLGFHALLRLGAVVVPVNPMSSATELDWLQRDTGARVALLAQELLPRAQALLQSGALQAAVVHAYADAMHPSAVGAADSPWPEPFHQPRQALTGPQLHGLEDALAEAGHARWQVDGGHPGPEALAVLPYTSGTTGHPKGCMHTHGTVLASNLASQVWRQLHAESVFLSVAPLFHMLGMQNGMNLPLTLGATLVMMPRWHAPSAARLIEQHRVTVWTAPPSMVIDFFAQPDVLQRDLSSLSLLSGGGAAMPEAVATLLAERFGLAYNEAYGLSETAAFLHANPLHRGKRQCLGVPTPGVVSRIVDPETLAELPAGEVGELVTSGPQVMQGYWRNPAATEAAFFERDGLRFFRTGDLASVDEDGYFFMRDRLKRMINASGFKVWPAEVESALYEHPAIHEACVIAVDDARRGETVKALVVLKPAQRGQLSEAELIAWGRERMAVYKAPALVEFVDQLPKSGTGKILWRELQEAHRQRAQAAPASATDPAPATSSAAA